MKTWRLTLRLMARDWRSGELLLLGLAVMLTVAAVTAVGSFTDRIQQAMQRQGGELIAADLLLDASTALPAEFEQRALSQGLSTAKTLEFSSVVLGEKGPQLVQVKAVSPDYPLRGQLLVTDRQGGAGNATTRGPSPGEIWVEPRLLMLLNGKLGMRLRLGEAELRIARLLEYEPDRGARLFQLAPRVMLALVDIPGTGLVTPASRVRHRLLIAGPAEALKTFQAWVENRLPPGIRMLDSREARPQFAAALDRASRFLALATLVTLLVAGAAIALASNRLVERQTDAVAIMRCLGAPRHLLMRVFLLRLLLFALAASLLGGLVGYTAQLALASALADWFVPELPAPSLQPAALGIATGLITLSGFALPSLLRLARVPPLRALRRDLGAPPPSILVAALGAALALGGLIFWQAGDAQLARILLSGVVGGLLALALAALLVTAIAARLQSWSRGTWRLGLASLTRKRGSTMVQLMGFGLAILALLLLAIVRVDLLHAWQQSLPAQTPNHFLINIQPQQMEALGAFLDRHALEGSGLHPIVRGRLIRINDRAVEPGDYADSRAQRLAEREFNLTWSTALQRDNRVVAGRWWGDTGQAGSEFSVEQGLAETLGIRLGDRLRFLVAGREVSARVTSLRSVQWDSFNVNFFVIGTPELLREQPATYVTSFYLPQTREPLLAELIRLFPNVTPLDVGAILSQVRRIMDRGALAVEYVFGFTLLAAFLVMYAGIQASQEARMAETAILRTLGARRRQVLATLAVEFTALGLLAGFLASLFAELTGWLLAQRLFELEFSFNPGLWLVGVAGSGLGIGLAGTLVTFPLLMRPPLHTLRRVQ